MKFKKEYAILLFIIAVLVFYISTERSDRTNYTLPEVRQIQKADISKIDISTKGAEVVLVKEGEGWSVGPERYPASHSAVEKMIAGITDLKLTALVSESENYPFYELDEDHAIMVNVFKGDESLLRITIGKPASSYRHTFVLLGDDHHVYHAEGNLRSEFKKTVADLRDRQVLKISDEITEITLKKGSDTVTIVKEAVPEPENAAEQVDKEAASARSVRWITADGKPVKQNDIDEIVSTLSHLDCDAFIDDRNRDDFTSPVYTVTLKGSTVYSLALFEKKDNRYPAVSSQSDYPFFLSEWKADRIMKDLSSLPEER